MARYLILCVVTASFLSLQIAGSSHAVAGFPTDTVPANSESDQTSKDKVETKDVSPEKEVLSSTIKESDSASSDVSLEGEPAAGHSFHGEVFNEGPRQAAYLMPGLGHVDFPVSTSNELAQRFFEQGVAQLHGFWYYEAERSFRQAAVFDDQCAMCYWGMALANVENRPRARDFVAQAVERQQSATHREQMYITAFEKFCRDTDADGKEIDKQQRAKNYTRDLEEIVEEFPTDIEARALLALQLWQNERADMPIVSHVAVDSVLQDVFDANPMHPAHHYRIHLWDKHKPERALKSSALCGASLPAIAHMWHMPGHIYSGLHRYQDAVWQQEASARVDHAHMMRDRVLPDQIHNFAHNNEWLIRNLIKIGRVQDALALAQNMQTLPRHPKLNTLDKSGSAKLGRERLLLTLSTYRLWPELIELAQRHVIEPTDQKKYQIERTRYLGIAYALSGQGPQTATELATLEAELDANRKESEQFEISVERPPQPKQKKGESPAEVAACQQAKDLRVQQQAKRDELKQQREQIEKATASLRAARCAATQDWSGALELWNSSDLTDDLLKAEWLAASGRVDEAIQLVDKKIADNPMEVPSMAVKTWLLYQYSCAAGDRLEGGAGNSEPNGVVPDDQADSEQPSSSHEPNSSEQVREAFELTRQLACVADLDTPLLARLAPLATSLKIVGSPRWSADYQPASDIGERPNLDSLGPFRWHPYLASDFAVSTASQDTVRLKQLAGQPTIVVFYLGFGCLHCIEQLHALSPLAEDFQRAGIKLMAISSENVESLKTGLASWGEEPLRVPLHADPELTAFRAYRCFDDFERQPLHGTFLIDADGRVLWQDIGYEPFMDVDFLLHEAQRLLKLGDDAR